MSKSHKVASFTLIFLLSSGFFFGVAKAQEAGPDQAFGVVGVGGSLSQTAHNFIFTGSSTYSVPIVVPPGRKNMAPNLSLNYNSSSGNNWCGVGWDLSMGYIERSTKRGVPKYDLSDTFILSLGGSSYELVLIGGGKYRAKIESSFMKFYYDGTFWEVWDKSGTKYSFGSTPNSRIENSYGTFKWALGRVTDTNGNYFTISYTHDQGQIYLNQIQYTGNDNTGTSLTNTINFTLEPRTDIPPHYKSGSKITTAYRLSSIDIETDGLPVRKYVLGYIYSGQSPRSLLTLINRHGSDWEETTLPPITFSYQGDSYKMEHSSSWAAGFSDGGLFPISGDFNGDGLQDAGIYGRRYSGCMAYDYFDIALSDGTKFNSAERWSEASIGNLCYQQVLPFSPLARMTADFNGDGLTDCAYIRFHNNGTCHLNVELSTGATFASAGTYQLSGLYDDSIFTGDFDGDGRADVGSLSKSNGQWEIALSENETFSGTNTWLSGFGDGAEGTLIADFNGDSLTDIGVFANGQWQIALSDGVKFIPQGTWISNFGNGKKPLTVDFNGDGLTDAGVFDSETGRWSIALSDGTKFGTPVEWINDFGSEKRSVVGDFNGDGIIDAGVVDCGASQWTIAPFRGTKNDLLTQISNGLGGTTTITYTPSTQYDNTFLPFPVQTVSSITTSDGRGNSYTTSYSYSGGLYDAQAREFRGFAYVKTIDPDGNYTETFFLQDDIFKGKMQKQEMRDSEGNLLRKVENTWDSKEIYSGVVFPYPSTTRKFAYDGGQTQVQTNYTYDDYGNIIETEYAGKADIPGDERTAYAEYDYNTDKWILGSLSHSKVLDSEGKKASEVWYYYDGRGNLIKRVDWLDTGTNPTTQMAYDAYGNLTSITDARSNASITTYDSIYHTFPVSTTNALGQTSSTEWDYVGGVPLSTTDINGNTTYYAYDTFWREVRVAYLDGGTKGTFYNNFGDPTTQHIREVIAGGSAGSLWSETYFDGLGRTYKTIQTPGTYTETKYDIRGNIYQTSLPHYADDTPKWTTFQYDPLNRLVTTTHPDGTFTETVYAGWSATLYDANSHKNISVTDAYGNVIEVVESNEGDDYHTYYTYDAANNLIKVVDSAGNISRMAYDSLGRKISMDDPDMGHWTYRYDLVGNLVNQEGTKGQTIDFKYDALNRITSKNYPDGNSIVYRYDEGQNGKGQLTSIQDLAGNIRFSYDKLGRMIESIRTMDGKSYRITKKYNQLGQLEYIVYPDKEKVQYFYDEAGQIKTISGTENYVTDIKYNALGQIESIEYGNGTATDYKYNEYTLRLENLKTGGGSLQNFHYEFDNVGNIRSITDSVNSASQNFEYDDLYRLIRAEGSYGIKNYSYDSIGNIIEKDGVIYTYGGNDSGPHAVTRSSDGLSACYDANGNMIAKNGRSYEYDYENRLVKVTDESGRILARFLYDGDGGRVKKISGSEVTIYLGNLCEIRGNILTKFIFAGSSRIASRTSKLTEEDLAPSDWAGFTFLTLPDGAKLALAITLSLLLILLLFALNRQFAGVKLLPYAPLRRASFIGLVVVFLLAQTVMLSGCGSSSGNSIPPQNTPADNSSDPPPDDPSEPSPPFIPTTYYYYTDHLGSSNVITNSEGEQVQLVEYAPFGEVLVNTGTADVNHKFTGQEFDDETGLYFYGARYYDSSIARFITADTTVQEPFDPQTLNRYTYCFNNPLIYTDPTGEFALFAALGFLAKVAGIFSTAVSVVNAAATGDWQPVAAMAGAFVGAMLFAPIGKSLAGCIAGKLGGSSYTFAGGFLIGGAEFATAGFGAGFGGALASGANIDEAFGAGLEGFASGFAIGGLIEGSYLAGWQDELHGMSREEVLEAISKHLGNAGKAAKLGKLFNRGWWRRERAQAHYYQKAIGEVDAATPGLYDKYHNFVTKKNLNVNPSKSAFRKVVRHNRAVCKWLLQPSDVGDTYGIAKRTAWEDARSYMLRDPDNVWGGLKGLVRDGVGIVY